MTEPKLEWMYRNSNEVVDKEEYLLGKPVDKAFEQSQPSISNEIEKDCLPTSIFSNPGSNVQVDVIRKLKEDPLEIIRQQEIERRKQLLKNPVKLKKIQNMLKVKESGGSVNNNKSKEKKEEEDGSVDIDKLLASKYLKIMKKHGIKSLSELSNMKIKKEGKSLKKNRKNADEYSSSSESESDIEEKRKRKKTSRKRRELCSSSSDSSEDFKKRHISHKKESTGKSKVTDKQLKEKNDYKERDYKRSNARFPSQRTNRNQVKGTDKLQVTEHKNFTKKDITKYHRSRLDSTGSADKKHKSHSLSSIEKQKRLEEMMENAKWRDEVRTKNVARYKKEESSEKIQQNYSEDFMRKQMMLATSHESVESRIKSNINNIQKSKFTMNENFVRR